MYDADQTADIKKPLKCTKPGLKAQKNMESQNCLMILIFIILGNYVIIFGDYLIILGAYVFIFGAYLTIIP